MELWQVAILVPSGIVLITFFGLVWACLVDRLKWLFSTFPTPPEDFTDTLEIIDPGFW